MRTLFRFVLAAALALALLTLIAAVATRPANNATDANPTPATLAPVR